MSVGGISRNSAKGGALAIGIDDIIDRTGDPELSAVASRLVLGDGAGANIRRMDDSETVGSDEIHYSEPPTPSTVPLRRRGQSRSNRLLAETSPVCKHELCRFANNGVVMTRRSRCCSRATAVTCCFALLPPTVVGGRQGGTAAPRRVVSRGEVAVGTTGSLGDPALLSALLPAALTTG